MGFANGGAVNAVAVVASNRLLIAGFALPTGATSSNMRLARFTRGGLLDTSFGSAAVVNTPLSGCTDARVTGITLDASGRVQLSTPRAFSQNVIQRARLG